MEMENERIRTSYRHIELPMIMTNALTMKVQTTLVMLLEAIRDFESFKVSRICNAIRNYLIRATVPSTVAFTCYKCNQ